MRNLEKFSGNVISKSEMMMVNGGGTCKVQTVSGRAVGGYSRSEAETLAGQWGTHWCCDNCFSASWT